MLSRPHPILVLAVSLLASATGCQALQGQKLAVLEAQNQTLTEQSYAQRAEIENLAAHSRKLESQVIEAEQTLARLDSQPGEDRHRLASNRTVSGISKFDADILFDEGKSELKPEAQKMLREIAGKFQGPAARELKIMIVGHTDNQQVARKPARELFPTNWHLSTARSVVVADFLRRAGVPEDRMGVAAFAHHQPVAANSTAADRQRNRRVEIFVTDADTPIVGWTETTPTLY